MYNNEDNCTNNTTLEKHVPYTAIGAPTNTDAYPNTTTCNKNGNTKSHPHRVNRHRKAPVL